jgi:hypothetical protein
MVKIAKEAGQKCTLDKPLYCPKNGEHLKYYLDFGQNIRLKSFKTDSFLVQLISYYLM